jgi:hypothetical protein
MVLVRVQSLHFKSLVQMAVVSTECRLMLCQNSLPGDHLPIGLVCADLHTMLHKAAKMLSYLATAGCRGSGILSCTLLQLAAACSNLRRKPHMLQPPENSCVAFQYVMCEFNFNCKNAQSVSETCGILMRFSLLSCKKNKARSDRAGWAQPKSIVRVNESDWAGGP